MPWNETNREQSRRAFVNDFLAGRGPIVHLARVHGVSERAAHNTLKRFREEGYAGLKERSRARHTQDSTPSDVVAKLVWARTKHPTWGPRKLKAWLADLEPDVCWPAASTIGSILKANGLVFGRRRRRRRQPSSGPCVHATAPNVAWSMDFKGHFKLGNGRYCYPFTVTDNASRYILACKAQDATTFEDTWKHLEETFREYGLPAAIRSDNGPPFGTSSLTGMSKMAVRLLRLGVIPDFIAPGKPQQNGRHERMHRTLKQETTKPPCANKSSQQRRFNRFVKTFNEERPHEALDNAVPASVYEPSPRSMPKRIPKPHYEHGALTRNIRHNGCFKWRSKEVFLAEPLKGETVALEPIERDIYLVRFCAQKIAVFDSVLGKIYPPGTQKEQKDTEPCARSKS